MGRGIATALATLALGTLGMVGLAPSASANPAQGALAAAPAGESTEPLTETPAGRAAEEPMFKIYGEIHFGGYEKGYRGTDRWFGNDEWDGTNISVQNGADSAQNLTTRTLRLYTIGNASGGDCDGEYMTFPARSEARDLANYIRRNTASCVIFLP